jgi:AcrR family transcriptional regulator
MTGKQARSRLTYERVLDAAAEEFARQGYPNTNLQRVAERTGLTKGALYGHFPSKEKLARALVEQFDAALSTLDHDRTGGDEGAHASGGPDGTALGKLRSLTFSLADRLENDIRTAAALRLVMDRAQRTGEPPTMLSRLRAHAVELVLEAQREWDVDPELPAERVANLLLAVLFGAHCAAPVVNWTKLPDRVREMWDLLDPALRGHRAEPGS